MDDNRPDPEELLRRIEAQEEESDRKSSSGRLKIFLGFCAGVGKTYTMLEETRTAVQNGIDAQIGIVETHGRKETEALLEGLTIIPRRVINYNNLELDELNIDEILERKPQLVIVDELAHTNIQGSRHTKRYQDVEEILKAGIDVYTTLNIQHVESLIDVVQQISNVPIHETVPDSILEMADEIELVDLTTEKLLERLHEGKIYIPQRAKLATQKFFRKGNLLALRELALRYTAKCVDSDMITYKNRNSITTPWPVDSKLLIGFSSSPSSERLLRITHRMASDMNAKWYAVYVESPQQVEVSEKAESQLKKNIRIAEELGAVVVSLTGNVIADTIINFAKEKNVTLIVAGLSQRSRIEEVFKGSVLNELTRKSGKINVLIVGGDSQIVTTYKKVNQNLPSSFKFEKNKLTPYILSAFFVSLIVFLGYLFREQFEAFNTGMLLILPVVLASIFCGTRVGLFTAVCAIASFDFFMIQPLMTFRISDVSYLPSFFVFILISVIISYLSKGIRWQTEGAKHRERFLGSLNAFTRETLLSSDILKTAVNHISEAFQCEAMVLIPDEHKQLEIKEKLGETIFDSKEYAVAHWVYKNGTFAGKGTDTLSVSKWRYLPLKIEDNVFGVLGITIPKNFSSEQEMLLESFASILASYLNRM